MTSLPGTFKRNAAGEAQARGLYDPANEHDACGVGFVARIDATQSHDIIEKGIEVLDNLVHRGAVGGDKKTGDGAGLSFAVPHDFFVSEMKDFKLPKAGHYGVGMIFMPNNEKLAGSCAKAIEEITAREGYEILGWRKLDTNPECLGDLARETMPLVWQVFMAPKSKDISNIEQKLYVIRRLFEKEVLSWNGADYSQFYVVSLSSKIIVYKGLFNGGQLPEFYPDLINPKVKSAFTLIHQRYSTNTLPTWKLAQPFRFLAHNGEINTLRGNINRMKAREAIMKSALFGDDIDKLKPIIDETGSDSAIIDNVLELIYLAGRSLPHAMMMMVPEAYGPRIQMSEDKRAFYEFHSALMEPWDGPAALVFSDGRYIGATLDRNGLRPARYTVTKDGYIVMASETGVVDIPGNQIRSRGRLQPGKMFLVDLEQKRIVPDSEIKAKISRRRPYRRWIHDKRIDLRGLFAPSQVPAVEPEVLLQNQHAFGYTDEDLRVILTPMASRGQEPVGSMGNDTALPVFSDRSQLVFSYFKQLFAQVTNPPIDPLREELVMSLESFLGKENNFLEESADQYRGFKLHHPILTIRDMLRIKEAQHPEINASELDMVFSTAVGNVGLEPALNAMFEQAEQKIAEGANLLVLTDKNVDAEHAPIPSLLACSGLHHHLIRKGLRNAVGIIVDTGEAREVMHFALLIGYGADAICPYMAFQSIRQLCEDNMLDGISRPEEAMDAYITAIKKGLLKTFSRMGISTVHSFFGSQIFEIVGLDKALVHKYFHGTASRLGGLGLKEIASETLARHSMAFPVNGKPSKLLDVGGAYRIRKGGEKHLWSTEAIYTLQKAVQLGDYKSFKDFSTEMNKQITKYAALRGLFTFKKSKSIPIDEVEPVEKIIPRFVGAAMSFGSISKEAHETIAIGMNRVGARSNSGEGGEDPARFEKMSNGDWKRSSIKQVASGRFGVTTDYLVNADELQIKMAQGAKPGEGGQLPGHKVSADIARVRHTTPGVTLISPPPHHDIYSIEDLAQLIFDLKAVSAGRVSVKLVSEVGVGTIASGVAKAKADTVLISGQDGGTGASPLTAIKHAGLPWELGLSETQQSLIGNGLRDRIRVQVDGQLKTGRDLAIAALLGAEEFGFGTGILVSLGCVMMRKCHLNTCPVGVATQDERLRSRFTGKPEYVANFLTFIAEELREYMAELGFRTLDEMIGRVDLIDFKPAIDHWKAKHLDLTPLLNAEHLAEKKVELHCVRKQDSMEDMLLDHEIIEKVKSAFNSKKTLSIDMPIRNIHRTVGARLSGEMIQEVGPDGLPDNSIQVNFSGSSGQSFGAFLAKGITFKVEGDTNDYLGKGLSGGKLIVVPPKDATFSPQENVIVGNVVLYGATKGELYVNGLAGERFAVRNSGATAVVEGVGDHGCEYMTGGTVVVIGSTGKNFAAGMSGGVAYVYDETELFDTRCNLDMVDLESVWSDEDKTILHKLLENHVAHTGSQQAKRILDGWEAHLPLFVKVIPIDYRKVLERMRMQEETDNETVSATEEVYWP